MAKLDHSQILHYHDKAYTSGQNNREKASDDIVFSRLTQWDETILSDVLTEYRGEFNIIRKERRRALKEMAQNPIQVNFKPLDGADPNAGDILNGMFRNDMRNNRSKTAIAIASQDQVDCGYGAWRIVTEYEHRHDSLDNNQVIRRQLIHEANNVVFWDPNAKEQDKSDAAYCTILTSYSEDGWKKFAEENGLDEDEHVPNFSHPAESFVYPWTVEPKKVRIGEFYYRTKTREKVFIYQNPMGDVSAYRKSEIKNVAEQLAQAGFEKVAERWNDRYVVDKYIVSGTKILMGPERIAGEFIPVVPVYGEWSYVEGEEVYEGITRLAKDPQRLHNFQMSYLADIVAKGNRKKPFFTPEQIKGHEYMYEQSGAEFNFPFYLINSVDAGGKPLPMGPLNYMEQPEIPQALAGLLGMTRQSIEDVTGPGVTAADMDPTNVSGKAISLQHRRADSQQIDFQGAMQVAMRRDALIYSSIASEVYDTPRPVTLVDEMGEESEAMVMAAVIDPQTGQPAVLNDLTKGSFEVYTDIGPAYATVKEETRDQLKEMYTATAPVNPQMANVILMQFISMSEGADMKSLRDYASNELLKMGVREPKNQQEMMMLQQMQQQQDPAAMAAQAEGQARIMEGQAALQNEANDAEKNRIELLKVALKEQENQIKAAEVGAKINNINSDTMGKRLDNLQKATPQVTVMAGTVQQ